MQGRWNCVSVCAAASLILGNKALAAQLKMTRRRISWVPEPSGGLVNLGLDADDVMVSGLSYKSFTVRDGCWSQQVRQPEARGREKYHAAWRTMIPFRLKPKFPAPHPLDDAGLFSYLMVSWLTPLMIRGARNCLDENTIPQMSVHDASTKNGERLRLLWEEEVSRRGIDKASVFRVMLRFQRTRVIFNILAGCCFSAASVFGPMLVIPKLLEYSEEQSGSIAYGIGLCFALFFTECLKSMGLCSFWVLNQRTGVRFRTAIFSFAFERLIQFKSLTHITVGEAISFFTRDINYLFEAVYNGPLALLSCLLLLASSIASCLTLGPTALIATLCYLLILPLEVFTTLATLNSMQLSVFLAPFAIKGLTNSKPAAERFKVSGQRPGCAALGMACSSAFTTVKLLPHVTPGQGGVQPGQSGTVSLSDLRCPIGMGLGRQKFFLQESPDFYVQTLKDPSKTLVMEEATLSWRKTCPGIVNGALELENGHTPEALTQPQPPLGAFKPEDKGDGWAPELHKINLVVSKGTMLGVCGKMGSGKSSLLSAILGEMHLLEGSVGVHGSLAYVPQQAWIIAGSIRENILLGSQYDEARYLRVLHCCSLHRDLEILPFGDMTEIGERGLNLSGGQKQRISLARAVYSDHELFLLDDPLSAVDVHVGKHIFEECIKKTLRGKTVVLVTHQLQYLEFCDQIILLEDGKICEKGTHSELIQNQGQYAQLIRKMKAEATQGTLLGVAKAAEESQVEGQAQTTCQEEPLNENAGLENQLTRKEKMEEGSLKWSVYHHYIQVAGGYLVSAMVFLLSVVMIFLIMFSMWWLSHWLEQGSGTNRSRESNGTTADPGDILDNPQLPFYQLVYGLGALFLVFIGILFSLAFTKVTVKASTTLHNNLLSKVFRCPMSFFDTTPIGRLLNCFSGDLDELDQFLPTVAEQVLLLLLVVVFILLMISVLSPYILLMGIVLLTVCLIYCRVLKRANSLFRRLGNYSRSPLFSHILTSLHGLSSIHVYGKTEDFIDEFKWLTDTENNYLLMFLFSTRWMSLRLELMTNLMTLVVAFFILFSISSAPYSYKAMAISLVLRLASMFQGAARIGLDTEGYFTAMERMLQYLKVAPKDDWSLECLASSGPLKALRYCKAVGSRSWQLGAPGAETPGLFCSPQAHDDKEWATERGGKSSLGVALFRLVEPARGRILIDGVDICSLGLEDLRSKFSIIPQDPVLLPGTIRFNLDPFDRCTDEQIWDVLERTFLSRMIIVIDEATASIDLEADALIQHTIREGFRSCTVLVIAHRISTVLNCDRILVMDKGKVVEFDRPEVLQKKPGSVFAALLASASSSLSQ
ncbi:ATP-binding cassette sub-family C member 11 isoform 2 [Camelus ferus]|nr:ATP-binding cassette sub-family C member 11 isoform 2 [Camelus ferus]